jgi:translation elongation factor EF-Tu-like GTPase
MQQILQPQFIAELRFKTTEEGGRQTPIWSGGFVNAAFNGEVSQWGGKTRFINVECLQPGDVGLAYLTFAFLIETPFKISEGMTFLICEGARITGFGTITKDLRSSK